MSTVHITLRSETSETKIFEFQLPLEAAKLLPAFRGQESLALDVDDISTAMQAFFRLAGVRSEIPASDWRGRLKMYCFQLENFARAEDELLAFEVPNEDFAEFFRYLLSNEKISSLLEVNHDPATLRTRVSKKTPQAPEAKACKHKNSCRCQQRKKTQGWKREERKVPRVPSGKPQPEPAVKADCTKADPDFLAPQSAPSNPNCIRRLPENTSCDKREESGRSQITVRLPGGDWGISPDKAPKEKKFPWYVDAEVEVEKLEPDLVYLPIVIGPSYSRGNKETVREMTVVLQEHKRMRVSQESEGTRLNVNGERLGDFLPKNTLLNARTARFYSFAEGKLSLFQKEEYGGMYKEVEVEVENCAQLLSVSPCGSFAAFSWGSRPKSVLLFDVTRRSKDLIFLEVLPGSFHFARDSSYLYLSEGEARVLHRQNKASVLLPAGVTKVLPMSRGFYLTFQPAGEGALCAVYDGNDALVGQTAVGKLPSQNSSVQALGDYAVVSHVDKKGEAYFDVFDMKKGRWESYLHELSGGIFSLQYLESRAVMLAAMKEENLLLVISLPTMKVAHQENIEHLMWNNVPGSDSAPEDFERDNKFYLL